MDSVDEIVGFEEPGNEADRLAYQVLGAGIEVHRVLGPGHPESAYEEALCLELAARGVPFERQFKYDIVYKGTTVGMGKSTSWLADWSWSRSNAVKLSHPSTSLKSFHACALRRRIWRFSSTSTSAASKTASNASP